ncbi:MAG TPA: cytochrome c biogenesis protein DipZ, partial [Candidatus Margulisiibacteriota bacterium]|nr:cytochrome c biogenesis protein DipZ [Candidatus Margulisiibacteriota bacterium]
VHTPEFAFEKETGNVEGAIRQFKINYPVAQDNNYNTWQAYNNHYWPAAYLIDANGHLRKAHFGEGQYDEMEEAIRQLLEESGKRIAVSASALKDETPDYSVTPETYLGLERMERFASVENPLLGKQAFHFPQYLPQDHFAYEGLWEISESSVSAARGSAMEIRFKADKVFLVISPNTQGDKIRLFLDNDLVNDANAGRDVKNGELILDEERLYSLIDLKGKIESHLLRLEFESEGVSLYAFTFG